MLLPILQVALVRKSGYGPASRPSTISDRDHGSSSEDAPYELDYYDTLELLHRQEILEKSLSKLSSYMQPRANGNTDSKGVANVLLALEDAQCSSTFLSRFVKRVADVIPAHQRPPTPGSTAKANEVFCTPELMENILGYLSTPDKLDAMRVQRTWFDTVNGSVKLLRALGLKPHHEQDGYYYSPFSHPRAESLRKHLHHSSCHHSTTFNMPGAVLFDTIGRVHPEPTELRRSQTYHPGSSPTSKKLPAVAFQIEIRSASAMRLGSRLQHMSLCNPPIKNLRMIFDCRMCKKSDCGIGDCSGSYELTTEHPLGFTLGHINDYANQLKREHPSYSPTASSIVFSGLIPLCDDDPFIKVEAHWSRHEWGRYLQNQEPHPMQGEHDDRSETESVFSDEDSEDLDLPKDGADRKIILDYDDQPGGADQHHHGTYSVGFDRGKTERTSSDEEQGESKDRDAPKNEVEQKTMLDYDDQEVEGEQDDNDDDTDSVDTETYWDRDVPDVWFGEAQCDALSGQGKQGKQSHTAI